MKSISQNDTVAKTARRVGYPEMEKIAGLAGLIRNLFHLPNTPLLSPPSAGHFN
ncbi:MAG: hypothetical protein LBD35_04420 [Prevotellaceae bacterium]|nr:hypothetical protein [Prevotellaceae bacterium]